MPVLRLGWDLIVEHIEQGEPFAWDRLFSWIEADPRAQTFLWKPGKSSDEVEGVHYEEDPEDGDFDWVESPDEVKNDGA